MSWLKKSASILTLVCLVFQLFFAVVDPAYAEESTTPTPEPPAVDSSTSQTQTPAPAADPSAPNPFFEPIGNGTDITADSSSQPKESDNPSEINSENSGIETEKTETDDKKSDDIALTDDDYEDSPYDRKFENNFCKNCNLKQTNGSLSYTYKLEVPKGRSGMEPEIYLNYSQLNRSPDSIAGYGWEINTGGYIERVKRKGVEKIYSLNEFIFNFNGNSSTLLPVSLSDGTHGQYGAKIEEHFFKYEFLSNDSWLITDTLGKKYYYGVTDDSRQTTDEGKYKWMLEKIEDNNGNTISYYYFKDSGQIYPKEIKYSGNESEEGIYIIKFEPFASGNPVPLANNFSYANGYEVNTRFRLDKVTVTIAGENNNNPIKEYRLEYGTKPLISYDFLNSIQEFSWNGNSWDSLPKIDFEYYDGGTGWDFFEDISYSFNLNPPSPYLWGDLNGDGYEDFSFAYNNTITSYLNDTSSFWNDTDSWQMPYEVPWYEHRSNLLQDINNDGFADFLSFNNFNLAHVYLNNKVNDWGSDLGVSEWYAFYPYNGTVIYSDANADGLADTYRYEGCGGATCYIIPVYNTGSHGWLWDGKGVQVYDSQNTRLLDYNNDGLNDIIEWNNLKVGKLITHIGAEKWREASYPVPGQNTNSNGVAQPYMYADINGDGLTDLIMQGATTTDEFYFGNGKNGWSPAGDDWGTNNLTPIFAPHHWFVDQNNDGFTDVITSGRDVFRNNTTQPPYTLKKVRNNTGGEIEVEYKNAKSYSDNRNMKSDMFVVDNISYFEREEEKEVNTFSYGGGAHLREDDDPYSWEFRGFNWIKTTDKIGDYTIEYFHQGNETASTTGEYDDHFSKKGKMYRQEIYDKNGNLYALQINKYDKDDLGNGRFFPKLVRTLNVNYDGDADYKARASVFSYDSYGNLTEKVNYGEVGSINDDGSFTDTGIDLASTTISYVTNTASNIVSLPTRQTLADQSGNKVKETKYYYDNLSYGNADKGNLTKEEAWISGTGYADTEKVYNSYGLVTEEKDPRDKVTTYEYDSYNLYVATSTNPLSQSTAYTYDYSSGKVKTIVDPNGNMFETVYDAFDRPIEEKEPDPENPGALALKSSYAYDDNSLPRMVKKTDYLSASSSVDSYIYLDGFDRKIQERKRAEDDNTFSVKDYAYDSRGLLEIETLPYFSSGASSTPMTSSSSLYTRYSYDPLQRVTRVVNSIATTTTAYDDWKVTITDGEGKTKDLYKDAYDNLVQVDEHNGASTYSTYYQYNLLGNLTKITDALNNVRNFTYDGLGRRLTAEDLHAQNDATYGTWTYGYDDSGNLTSRLDPKNQTVNYTYDDLNRVLIENYTGSAGTEVSYGYDSCQNGIGKMCSAATTASILNLAYNPLGLVSTENKTIASTTYQTLYSYDRQGNQTIVTLPDTTQVKNEYNPAGWLEKVSKKLPSDPSFVYLVEDIDYNPLGQKSYENYTNNNEINYTYDPDQLYSLSRKQSTITTTSLQDLNYTYDKVGNITQIIDSSNTNTAKTTNFAYDDLYRLTSAQSTNAVYGGNFNESYSYNAIGNITNKSNIGNYLYQNTNYANPHAATNINGMTYSYDNNGNLTSDGTWTHTWDYDNRLTQSQQGTSTPVTYTYDQDGNRVKKTESGHTNYYINKFYEIDDGLKKRHIFAGDTSLATIEDEINTVGCMPPTSGDWTISSSCTLRTSAKAPASVIINSGATLTIATSSILEIDLKHFKLLVKKGGGVKIKKGSRLRQTTAGTLPPTVNSYTYYHYTDHLGGSSLDTDQNGNIVETIDYLPFGATRIDQKTGAHENDYKFTGHEYDGETGMSYFGARYQNGSIGKFISVDPEARDNPEQFLLDPQQLSSYSYVRNNPVNLTDPDGRCVDGVSTIGCMAAWTFLGGIVTGIVTEFYGAITDNPSVIEVGQHLRQTSEIGGSGLLETNPYTGQKSPEIKVETSGKNSDTTGNSSKNTNSDPYGLKSPYSNIKDPATVGEGKNFTASQKEKIYQQNMERNGGVLKSDLDGQILVKPTKSQAGVKPPKNEAQIDHIQPKKPASPNTKPGTNSNSNAQVLSREQNRQKSNR